MNTRSITPTRLVLALATAGLLGGAGVSLVSGSRAHAAAPVALPPVASAAPFAGAPDFAQIAERHGAAVVNISVSGTRAASDDDEDEPAMPRGRLMRGQGSGFIIGADGTILTNAHVVRGAKEVTVKLTDRREFQAKVLGADPRTDIAVLKIDARNLPTVPLGSSRSLRVGEWVLAIGSPFGFENSVSAGVVSAKGRSLPDDSFVPFIQTDVAVNPGNSGGPLFNGRGEVVGINSQIFSRTGGYQGLSFAIPIDLAVRIKDQIVATGQARHARLGVAIQEVNQTLADSFKLDRPEGALVSSVDPGSPADKAGLKAGDVIRQVDGQAIVASGDLPALIGQSAPGQTVALEIWRQGERKTLKARRAVFMLGATGTIGRATVRAPAARHGHRGGVQVGRAAAAGCRCGRAGARRQRAAAARRLHAARHRSADVRPTAARLAGARRLLPASASTRWCRAWPRAPARRRTPGPSTTRPTCRRWPRRAPPA
jgi:serine protease Do